MRIPGNGSCYASLSVMIHFVMCRSEPISAAPASTATFSTTIWLWTLWSANFIIVQHFANPDPTEFCEGSRLCSFYDAEPLPYLGIINPLTGGEMKRINAADCSNVDRFVDASSFAEKA